MKIGLIGCGTHGRFAVIPAIREFSRRGQLTAVSDLNQNNLDQVSDVAKYTDYRQMLAKEPLDLVYVATLLDTHRTIVVEALSANKHVVCEKPMGQNVDECREMVSAAQKTNRKLVITFESRYVPQYRIIREWIDAGFLGRVEAVHLQYFWDGHKNFGPMADRRARLMRQAGGFDCGIHKLDLARFFGRGNWKTIHAMGAWLGESMPKPPHIGLVGRLDNGVLVTVNNSMGYAASIKPRPMNEVMVIVGTKGVASMALDTDSVEAFTEAVVEVRLNSEDRQEVFKSSHTSHSSPIGSMLDDLAAFIEDGTALPPWVATGEDGLQAQFAMDEANEQAVKERQTFEIHD